jgi:hypothetical protein
MGVVPDPNDPLIEESRQRFEQQQRDMFPQGLDGRDALVWHGGEQRAAHKRNQDKARKQKNKRKAASAARKTNRKKRR